MLPADQQAQWDAEDGSRILRAALDAERREEEALAEVHRIRQALAKAKRKALEARWDCTAKRVAWLKATASLRSDDEGLPLNEPDRSYEIARRKEAQADKPEPPPRPRRKRTLAPPAAHTNGEGAA